VTYPRRNQHDEWVPWLSDYIRGRRALLDQGVDMDQGMDRNTVARLGHALADLAPAHDPAMLAELDQIQAREPARAGADGDGPGPGHGPWPVARAHRWIPPEPWKPFRRRGYGPRRDRSS